MPRIVGATGHKLARRSAAALATAAAVTAAALLVSPTPTSDVRPPKAVRPESVRRNPARSTRPALVTVEHPNAARASQASCPWLDSSLPVSTRVNELLSAMTPLQEASLLHLHQVVVSIGYEGYSAAIPALCIPMITEQDGAAGVASAFPTVTQLPAPISDAAAFDPALADEYGGVIGSEDATKGVDVALAPTINIDRSPLWGRSYETLGEDPYLTASLGVPLVEGIQANRVIADVKHFAVYNQETGRGTPSDDAILSDQALHEIFLPAWSAVVQQAHPGSIMCSYNLINGTPACEDGPLINGILRGQWNFTGFVRSDCGSVYNQEAAIAVGLSQVKCTSLWSPVALADAVLNGALKRSTLDAMARPLLNVLFEYNIIASPHPLDRLTPATNPAHQAVALATANEGAVLLKNDGNLLPMDLERLPSLALIGGKGGTPMPSGFGAAHVLPTAPVSAEAALRGIMGDRLRYNDGLDIPAAVAVARAATVAVVVVHDYESEGKDRTTLDLPGDQNALVGAVAAANPHTIVVLETGSAVVMPWLSSVPTVLETWYPGQVAGISLADLLSGAADPSGKLPVTFPTTMAEMPDNTKSTFGGVDGRTDYTEGVDVGYRWYEVNDVTPAFPFGFGLSYTKFAFSGLHTSVSPSGALVVGATITNTGTRQGADVVQCYVGDPPAFGEPPRQLRGFSRVSLAPDESANVTFDLTAGDLASWDSATQTWMVPGGRYELWVGDGSDVANLPLRTFVGVGAANLGVNSGPAPAV